MSGFGLMHRQISHLCARYSNYTHDVRKEETVAQIKQDRQWYIKIGNDAPVQVPVDKQQLTKELQQINIDQTAGNATLEMD